MSRRSDRAVPNRTLTLCRYQVEVSDAAKIEQTIGQVVKDFGKLDVFVANAGMAISKAITEQTLDEYRKQMSVNGECQSRASSVTASSYANSLQLTVSSTAQSTQALCSSSKASVT